MMVKRFHSFRLIFNVSIGADVAPATPAKGDISIESKRGHFHKVATCPHFLVDRRGGDVHGDGHGGVHHHDGFINVNGIFEGRFDIILTNPPFGANVEPSDVVHETDVTPIMRGTKENAPCCFEIRAGIETEFNCDEFNPVPMP
jgi:hypothetical protein